MDKYISTLPEIQNIQRFLGLPISCLWWTDEPNKCLNILNALTDHIASIPTTNDKYDKFKNLQNNLKRLSFRMLILSISIIGKLVSIPVIRTVLKNLETKAYSKCTICNEPFDGKNFEEHTVCIQCQNDHKINDHIPKIILNLTGRPLDASLRAYKYHGSISCLC